MKSYIEKLEFKLVHLSNAFDQNSEAHHFGEIIEAKNQQLMLFQDTQVKILE